MGTQKQKLKNIQKENNLLIKDKEETVLRYQYITKLDDVKKEIKPALIEILSDGDILKSFSMKKEKNIQDQLFFDIYILNILLEKQENIMKIYNKYKASLQINLFPTTLHHFLNYSYIGRFYFKNIYKMGITGIEVLENDYNLKSLLEEIIIINDFYKEYPFFDIAIDDISITEGNHLFTRLHLFIKSKSIKSLKFDKSVIDYLKDEDKLQNFIFFLKSFKSFVKEKKIIFENIETQEDLEIVLKIQKAVGLDNIYIQGYLIHKPTIIDNQ